jgi:SpoVK/Ycf46/Vps4 family AAA+-type ATPase
LARSYHAEKGVGFAIFIDEAENLFKDREKTSESNNSSNVLQEFLNQLDGFHTVPGALLLIAATNKSVLITVITRRCHIANEIQSTESASSTRP